MIFHGGYETILRYCPANTLVYCNNSGIFVNSFHSCRGLSAATTYQLRVVSINTFGETIGKVFSVQTNDGLPERPSDMRAGKSTDRSIQICWEERSDYKTGIIRYSFLLSFLCFEADEWILTCVVLIMPSSLRKSKARGRRNENHICSSLQEDQ